MTEKAEEGNDEGHHTHTHTHVDNKVDTLRADIALEPVTYTLVSPTTLLVHLCC